MSSQLFLNLALARHISNYRYELRQTGTNNYTACHSHYKPTEMVSQFFMEYALGLSLTATFTFLAIWINDTFAFGGELREEDELAPARH